MKKPTWQSKVLKRVMAGIRNGENGAQIARALVASGIGNDRGVWSFQHTYNRVLGTINTLYALGIVERDWNSNSRRWELTEAAWLVDGPAATTLSPKRGATEAHVN
jgi:hypothetical protein